MADEKKNQSEAQGEGKNKLAKLLLPIFAVVNVATLAGGGFLVYQGTLAYEPPVLREPAAFAQLLEERALDEGIVTPLLYTMPPFTVNLNGTPRRLIRVEMTFEMLDKAGFEEIVRTNPAVRDSVVRILNGKSFDEIETIQGKLFLKDQIAVALNQSLKEGVVKNIFFNEFLVQ